MASGNGSALLDLRTARAALSAASGREKLDLLLSAPDPGALVRSLPPQELYLSILDIGLEDAHDLVALASPEQFQHFIDAGCWPKIDAGPDPRKVLRWLTLAREGANTDRGLRRFYEKLESLDAELVSMVLRRELTIHDWVEGEELDLAEDSTPYRSPDGKYVIEIHEGGAGYAVLKRLLDDLYARDTLGTTRRLEALRWELPTELEEVARGFRDGRLRDLGVPDFQEAMGFFARPAAAPQAAAASQSTALLAPGDVPLLARALDTLSDDERDQAEESVAYAANATLVFRRVSLDDAGEVRRVLNDARGLLSLGLELVSGGDVHEAGRALVDAPIRDVVQAAMRELYRLQSRARKIAQAARLPQAQSATLFDPPLARALEALTAQHPQVSDGRDEPHAPSSRAELHAAEKRLDEAEALLSLLAAMGHTPASLGPQAEEAGLSASALKASDVVRAHVLSQLAGTPFTLRDLPERDAPKPAGFADALDAALRGAATTPATQRAAATLRARV